MNEWFVALALITILVCLPFSVYLSVKLGTYGYFRGKQLFDERNKDE